MNQTPTEDQVNLEMSKHDRRIIRLREYDYSGAGAYFVTICAKQHGLLFGEVANEEMHLNDVGRVVNTVWYALPERFFGLELDAFVVMPNHVHGIVTLVGRNSLRPKVPRPWRAR